MEQIQLLEKELGLLDTTIEVPDVIVELMKIQRNAIHLQGEIISQLSTAVSEVMLQYWRLYFMMSFMFYASPLFELLRTPFFPNLI